MGCCSSAHQDCGVVEAQVPTTSATAIGKTLLTDKIVDDKAHPCRNVDQDHRHAWIVPQYASDRSLGPFGPSTADADANGATILRHVMEADAQSRVVWSGAGAQPVWSGTKASSSEGSSRRAAVLDFQACVTGREETWDDAARLMSQDSLIDQLP